MYYGRDFSYAGRPMARSVANIFDPVCFSARNESTHKRKSAEDRSSSSRHKTFSHFSFNRHGDDYLHLPPIRDDDDGYFFEEYKRVCIGRAPAMQGCSEVSPPEHHYFSTYTEPCNYTANDTMSPKGAYECHSYTDHDLEDKLAHPLQLSLGHNQYGRDPGLPMGRINYIPVSEDHLEDVSMPALLMTGAFNEDDVVLSQDHSSLYDTSKTHIDHAPFNEGLIHGVLGTLEAMMTTVVDSVHPVDDTYTRIMINPEVERHHASPQRVYPVPRGARHTDHREFTGHKTFHSGPQSSRSRYGHQFVNPRQIPLHKPEPEPTSTQRADSHRPTLSSKAQLERYNQWWTDVQGKTMITKPALESIPFLSPSTPFNARTANAGQDWKWAAYKFFCLAFDLHPKSIPQPDYSNQ
jgi:hypothetical protein